MLNKLKRKFITINMSLVGLVIAVVFAFVCSYTYTENYSDLYKRLEKALDIQNAVNQIPEIGGGGNHFDKAPEIDSTVTSTVVVTLDKDKKLLYKSEFFAKISDEALNSIIEIALDSDKDSDMISSMKVMFLKEVSRSGKTKIAITDTTELYETMNTTAITGLILCVAILAIMFAVSLFLSSLAIKPVDEAWKKQKQFVADASHELKTPLTVILANNNILRSHPEQTIEEQSQWLESTEEEAIRMKKLIDQMLFLAKSDAEQKPATLTKTNVSEITERAALTFEPVAFEKSVNIRSIIAPNIILNSDTALYDRLLHILMDNAIKHAHKGSTITLALQRNGNKTFLSVQNYGDVISEEDLPHIFDRFYRADKSRTSDAPASGYGLGLAIAKNVLKTLNGEITVSSNESSGTTFTVAF